MSESDQRAANLNPTTDDNRESQGKHCCVTPNLRITSHRCIKQFREGFVQYLCRVAATILRLTMKIGHWHRPGVRILSNSSTFSFRDVSRCGIMIHAVIGRTSLVWHGENAQPLPTMRKDIPSNLHAMHHILAMGLYITQNVKELLLIGSRVLTI